MVDVIVSALLDLRLALVDITIITIGIELCIVPSRVIRVTQAQSSYTADRLEALLEV